MGMQSVLGAGRWWERNACCAQFDFFFWFIPGPRPMVCCCLRMHVSNSANLPYEIPHRHAHMLFSCVIPDCVKLAINTNHSRIIYFFVDILILEVTDKHIFIYKQTFHRSLTPNAYISLPGSSGHSVGEQLGASFTWLASERCWIFRIFQHCLQMLLFIIVISFIIVNRCSHHLQVFLNISAREGRGESCKVDLGPG